MSHASLRAVSLPPLREEVEVVPVALAGCAYAVQLHRPWRHFDSNSWFHGQPLPYKASVDQTLY